MVKDKKLRVWMYLSGFVTFLSCALAVLSGSSKITGTSCTDGYGLNDNLPIFQRCPMIRHPNGSMIQTIPKLFSFQTVVEQIPGLAGRQIICSLPGLTESSTTEVTTVSNSITKSEQPEMPSQETTTMSACTSSPIEVQNRGSLYNFGTSKTNHSSALSCCSEHDSHLVFIETRKEQNFIQAQIEALDPSVDYWIGLRGNISRGDTTWWDGSSLRYDNSYIDVEHECFVIKSEQNYKWHDRACFREYKYICEK